MWEGGKKKTGRQERKEDSLDKAPGKPLALDSSGMNWFFTVYANHVTSIPTSIPDTDLCPAAATGNNAKSGSGRQWSSRRKTL